MNVVFVLQEHIQKKVHLNVLKVQKIIIQKKVQRNAQNVLSGQGEADYL